MSFDSFYDEAQFNQAKDGIKESDLIQSMQGVEESEEEYDAGYGDMWDDDYDWSQPALSHEGYNDVQNYYSSPVMADLLHDTHHQMVEP